MKIKHIYILSFVVSVLTLASCADALNSAPSGRINEDDIFSDNDKVGAYLNSCYDNMPAKGVRYFFWMRGPVEISDEAWDTDAEAEPTLMSGRMYNGNASAGYHPIVDLSTEGNNGDYWDYYWHSIRFCSVFLSKIGTATVKNESDRKRWTAEAHLLRAYYYSELLKWFGMGLPIEKEPYDYAGDFSKVKRASYYETVKFVMAECDSALNTPELPWRITTTGEAGRVNKSMALAIKSRMILFTASPLYNKGINYWEEAYQVNKTCLEGLRAQGYELYHTVNIPQTYLAADAQLPNQYAALYNEYFTNSMAYSSNPIDRETIFQSRDGQGNIWDIDGVGAQDGYKSGTCPSQELVDSYETKDGQPILDLASPYLDEKHTQPNYNLANKLYDPNNPYENRDPRFYADIYYNGSKRTAWWEFAETSDCIENYPAPIGYRARVIATWVGEPKTGIDRTRRSATRTGYFERKFLHPNSGNRVVVVGGAYFKLFRLGEVILNYAEAAAEANHLPEATAAVNEIRERVGMPDIPSGLSQSELILRVRHERRVELAMEENRYFDIRRWTSPTDDLSKTDKWIGAMEITRNSNGTFTYTRRPVRAVERKCYTNKFLWLPISINEANRTRVITGESWQNPGW